jgi:hypothetical protein
VALAFPVAHASASFLSFEAAREVVRDMGSNFEGQRELLGSRRDGKSDGAEQRCGFDDCWLNINESGGLYKQIRPQLDPYKKNGDRAPSCR